MPSLPKEISDFMESHGVLATEIWQVRPGTYAIKHAALERVAAEKNITFSAPAVLQIDLEKKLAGICVTGKMGDRAEWSTGESAPYNTKPGYPLAMAEKRAKDRCILKLLHAHGTLYSEDEADDFKRPNPHVTRPADINPVSVEYDERGEPVDNIPSGEPGIERLPKSKARADFEAAQKEMRATVTIKQLETWGQNNANRIQTFPADWAEMFRGLYAEHRDELRRAVAA